MAPPTLVVPRVRIEDCQELRARVDIDPEGNRALRLEVHAEDTGKRAPLRGPLWINLQALDSLRADFAF
jgi:hypothetical protein